MRKIPKVPFKVLDAPELQDDFYLNLVDWSSTNVLRLVLLRTLKSRSRASWVADVFRPMWILSHKQYVYDQAFLVGFTGK